MVKKILTFIQYKTSWLAILLLLATTVLMMFLMNGTQLPFSNPTIMEHSGGLKIQDIRDSFTPDDAYELKQGVMSGLHQSALGGHLGVF